MLIAQVGRNEYILRAGDESPGQAHASNAWSHIGRRSGNVVGKKPGAPAEWTVRRGPEG